MNRQMQRRGSVVGVAFAALGCTSTASDSPAAPPPCEQSCQDAIALRAIREGLKTAYNRMLTGNETGPQDETSPCPLGGRVHVFGTATSNAAQGATRVSLSYELDRCGFASFDADSARNYSVVISGTVTQDGTLAVQPTATTALVLKSERLDVTGTVSSPPLSYAIAACGLAVGQDASRLAGTLCGRAVGVAL